MAIEYVGGVSGSRAGSTSTTTQSLSATLTGGIATSPSDGDLVVVSVVIGTAGRTPSCAISTPSGYTNLGVLNGSDSFDTRFDVSYKFYDSGDGTTITIPSTGDTADAQAWTVQVFRGVDPTTPLDVTPTSATGNNTSRINPPAITPVTVGAWVVFMGGGACSTGADYTISGDTDALRAIGNDTNDAVIMAAYVSPAWSSGAVDPAASTTGSNNSGDSWASYTLALRPNLAEFLTDNFDGASIDTAKWDTITSTGCTITQSGGELLPDVSGASFKQAVIRSANFYDLTGSEFVVKLTQEIRSSSDASGAEVRFFCCLGDPANGDTFGFYQQTGGNLDVDIRDADTSIGGSWPTTIDSDVFTDTTYVWFRIREDSGTVYFDTATDSASDPPVSGDWTNRASIAVSSLPGAGADIDNVKVTVGSAIWGSATVTTQAKFDGFNTKTTANVTHDATGAIEGGGATVSGTAARNATHDATGAIAGDGAVVSGTAARNATHDASGAIQGDGAVVAGSAALNAVTHDATGAIQGGGAVLSGTAALTLDPDRTHSVQDSFEGTSLDTAKWDVVEIGTPTGGVSVSGGNLEINQTNNTLGTGYIVRTDATKDFESSKIFARLVSGLIASNNQDGAEADFGVHADVDSGYMWQQRSNGTLVPAWKVAGVHTDGPAFAYTAQTHGWLRIRESGGTVYWEHAPATALNPPAEHEWITDHTRTRAADGTFAINLMRIRFMSLMSFGTPGVPVGPVKFSCVNMRTDAVVTHDATGAITGDGAVVAGVAARQVNHDATGAIAGGGATIGATASRGFEHTATGAIVGGGAIISAEGSTSDITRKIWLDTQDTAGAWSDEPQSADPWTDVPPNSGSWGS